jgi:hypothetical protein
MLLQRPFMILHALIIQRKKSNPHTTYDIYGPSLCPGSGLRGMLFSGTGTFELGNTPYRPYVFWSTLT